MRVSEPRCPFCHDEIVRGDEPVCCPACHAAHHEACLREHPACGGCGAVHPRFAGFAAFTGFATAALAGRRAVRRPLPARVGDLRGLDAWVALASAGLVLAGVTFIAVGVVLVVVTSAA